MPSDSHGHGFDSEAVRPDLSTLILLSQDLPVALVYLCACCTLVVLERCSTALSSPEVPYSPVCSEGMRRNRFSKHVLLQ